MPSTTRVWPPDTSDLRLLIVGPNWLGDGIMAMPALQALRDILPADARLTLAVKPGQAGLWRMQPACDEVIPLPPSTRDLPAAVRRLREGCFSHAVLLPNSFRSALAPFLAGIPHRRGTPGQLRRPLVNDPVDLTPCAQLHQQWEMARLLLGSRSPAELPAPRLRPPPEALAEARQLLARLPARRLGLIPGAARGPSKRWPGERFREVARGWLAEGGGVCWLGTPEDIPLCQELSDGLGPGSITLAGKTSLPVFAAVLHNLSGVVANDSGGMHLAAAMGTPVVAVFGLTDPAKTGPLHPRAVVVKAPGARSRAIARDSAAARAALAAVPVSAVLEPVLAICRRDG